MQLACRLHAVAESSYYEWRSRPPSARAIRHAWLTDQIRAVHTASRGTYGALRVHAELTLGLGLQVGHNQIEMLMARAAIKGLPGNRRARARHETPTAGDLVERMFTREAPNRLWVTDITEHRTSRASCTARSCWTRSPGESLAGRSTPARPRRWSPMLSAWPLPTAIRSPFPIAACNSPHGPSPTAPSAPAWSRPWAPSATVMTTQSSNPSGAECKPSYSTANAGDTDRAGQRDLRLFGDLPQPPTPPFRPRNAHSDRVRSLHQSAQPVA